MVCTGAFQAALNSTRRNTLKHSLKIHCGSWIILCRVKASREHVPSERLDSVCPGPSTTPRTGLSPPPLLTPPLDDGITVSPSVRAVRTDPSPGDTIRRARRSQTGARGVIITSGRCRLSGCAARVARCVPAPGSAAGIELIVRSPFRARTMW